MKDQHDCTQHRDAWVTRYAELATRVTQARSAVQDAKQRELGQRSAHGKRVDRAVSKRRDQHGGVMPSGPMPLLGVGRKALDRAIDNIEAAIAERERAYSDLHAHRLTCAACYEALAASLLVCCACGLRRHDVTDDPPDKGIVWERCKACREAGVEVPV